MKKNKCPSTLEWINCRIVTDGVLLSVKKIQNTEIYSNMAEYHSHMDTRELSVSFYLFEV